MGQHIDKDNKEKDQKFLIIDAAERLFAQKGFNAVTIREIARKAGVNSAMIYYYFGDKAGLYTVVINNRINLLTKMINAEREAGKNPIDKLKRIIYAFVDIFSNNMNRKISLLISQAFISEDENIIKIVSNYGFHEIESIEKVIQEGIDLGIFKKVNTKMAVISLVGTIATIFNAKICYENLMKDNYNTEKPSGKLAENICKFFVNDLLLK